MRSVVGFIKRHPKKLLLLSACCFYSANYFANEYRNAKLRRSLCSSLLAENHNTVTPSQRIRRLTVFMNPFSRRGKLLQEFEKNAAPLLHLAGLDVQMVYLDDDSELKGYLNILDPSSTDGVLLACDDHLVQNAVTGLLRREDFGDTLLWSLPIGVIPCGVWNGLSYSKFDNNKSLWYYNTLKPVIHGKTERFHALEISIISRDKNLNYNLDESESKNNEPKELLVKPVYALMGLEWTIWRDLEFGGGQGSSSGNARPISASNHGGVASAVSLFSPSSWIRNFGALWRSSWYWLHSSNPLSVDLSLLHLSPQFQLSADQSSFQSRKRSRLKLAYLTYTPVCSGCSRCWQKRVKERMGPVPPQRKTQNSTFSRLFGISSNLKTSTKTTYEDQIIERVENPECGKKYNVILDDYAGVVLALEDDRIRLDLMRRPNNYWDFVRQFLSWLYSRPYSAQANDLCARTLYCDHVYLTPLQTENEFYWIDNDYFEARPIHVRVRRDALNMFA